MGNQKGKKTFCFDIDGVIMTLVPGNDYNKAQPITETVELINKLYETGHYIILFTARGYITKIDWELITIQQLKRAGVKYHELKFGKPAADYYIDDRFIGIEALVKKVNDSEL